MGAHGEMKTVLRTSTDVDCALLSFEEKVGRLTLH
jgi:hypothetical protein